MTNFILWAGWIVGVISLYFFFRGSITYRTVKATPLDIADHIDSLNLGEDLPEAMLARQFLNRFMVGSVVELTLFLTEVSLAFYLVIAEASILMMVVAVKDFIWVMISFVFARKHLQAKPEEQRLFERLRNLPVWYLVLDRVSNIISAICFLGYFLLETKLIG